MLIPMISSHLPTHLDLLTLPPFCLPRVHFKTALFLLLWWTSSCDARVSQSGMSLCIHQLSPFTSLYPSKLFLVMCTNQQFSHIYPLLSVSRLPVYSQFFVLFLIGLRRERQMANSGQAGRRPSNTALMTAVIEWSLYVKWHGYDRSAGKDYFDCYTRAVAGHCTFLKVWMHS